MNKGNASKKTVRDSFVFYRSFFEAVQELDFEERGKILSAIAEFALNGEEADYLSGVSKAVFILAKPQLIANSKKYENGKKGGRPKQNQSGEDGDENNAKEKPKQNQSKTKTEAQVFDSKNQTESKPKRNVNENVNVNVNENVNEGESNRKGEYEGENKPAPARFQNPTIDEVKKVAAELGFTEKMAERFFYHYDANGWVQGKDKPIFNWVSALNSWAAKEHDFEKPQDGKKPYTERQYDAAALDALFE